MISNLIELAYSQIGYTEFPKNSNKTKYGEAYGWNGVSWCVIFLWWLFNQCGLSELFFAGLKTASCTSLKNYYQGQKRWITDDNYRVGDIAIMTFSKNREIQHCGLIVEKLESGKYKIIEGNTSSGIFGSQDNGGCVALKTRSISNILGVCRINYPEYEEDDEYMTNEKFAELMDNYLRNQADLPLPKWAEQELAEARELGITDATRPMQLIPRYQAAIMALRAAKVMQNNKDEK